MIVVDISPLNQDFDVTSSNEWNMEHYFYCLKGVHFDEAKTLFQVSWMNVWLWNKVLRPYVRSHAILYTDWICSWGILAAIIIDASNVGGRGDITT